MNKKRKITKKMAACFICLALVLTTINLSAFLLTVNAANIGDYITIDDYVCQVTGDDTVTLTYTSNDSLKTGDVQLPATLEKDGVTYRITKIGLSFFCYETRLTSIVIPEGVTAIVDSAFCDCTGLTSVTLPSTMQSIGNSAFSGCIKLNNITLPEGVASFGDYVFQNCTNLSSITLPSSLTRMGMGCFMECSGLTSITIPRNVTAWSTSTFEACTKLSDVIIEEGVTEIPNATFMDCPNLARVQIPASVRTIGNSVFTRGSSSIEVVIPCNFNQTLFNPYTTGISKTATYTLQHDFTAYTSNGDGTHKVSCKVCSADDSSQTAVACAGTGADCHTKATCEKCNAEFGSFDSTKHLGGTEIINKKDATCTTAGYTGDTYCKGCNEKIQSGSSIAALNHSFDSGVITTQPTTTAEGVKTYTCSRCGDTKTEAVAKLPDDGAEKQKEKEQQITNFATRMYSVALGRTPDQGGLDYWSDGLKSTKMDGASIARGFICSKEFKAKNLNDEEFLNVLYSTFFDREPDPDGKAYWLNVLKKGSSREKVLSGFVNSKEFGGLCESYGIARGTMEADGSNIYNANVRDFVLRNYEKALGRNGEVEGVEYWSYRINKGMIEPRDVAISFFHSKEYLDKNLDDAAYVETLYETFLGRSSDAEGKAYWIQKLREGSTRDKVLDGFAYSKEFGGILQSFGLK